MLTCAVRGSTQVFPPIPLVPVFAQSYELGAVDGEIFSLSGIQTLSAQTSLILLCDDANGAVTVQSATWYVTPVQTG